MDLEEELAEHNTQRGEGSKDLPLNAVAVCFFVISICFILALDYTISCDEWKQETVQFANGIEASRRTCVVNKRWEALWHKVR